MIPCMDFGSDDPKISSKTVELQIGLYTEFCNCVVVDSVLALGSNMPNNLKFENRRKCLSASKAKSLYHPFHMTLRYMRMPKK